MASEDQAVDVGTQPAEDEGDEEGTASSGGAASSGPVASVSATEPPPRRRWRTVVSWVLVVLACLLAVVSVLAVFVRNQLLNTDAYVATMTPLASDPAIQTQVAKKVSENLIVHGDVEQRIKNALPQKAGFLASPISSGLETLTDQLVLKAVQSPQFEQAWVTANRVSHKQLVAVLTGSGNGSVSTANGRVTIDLSAVEVQAKKRLDARGITVFDKVPAVKGLNFVLFQSDSLVKVQRLTKLLNSLSIALPIITLLLYAASVVLARNRRRGLVRAATGLALSMALILVVIAVARNQYLGSLHVGQSLAANSAAIDIVTSSLRAGVRIILIVAAVVAILSLVAGSKYVRSKADGERAPDWLTQGPVHDFVAAHRRALQWMILVVGLLVLVVWSEPTALVAVVVILITLAVIGLVGLYGGRSPTPAVAGLGTGDGPGAGGTTKD
ncbi:MAG TPA: hypothetical protein VHW93_07610 [Acidimicrobiales bacterium]|nr:hypothetical protein [Acidimicrobiales bacterium]